MICRIEQIIKKGGDPTNPTWPMIEVTWQFAVQYRFYEKSDIRDLSNATDEELSWIGENEVFETDCVSKIFADLLHGKCKIWDILEFDGRTDIGIREYYTRAKYNIKEVSKYMIVECGSSIDFQMEERMCM